MRALEVDARPTVIHMLVPRENTDTPNKWEGRQYLTGSVVKVVSSCGSVVELLRYIVGTTGFYKGWCSFWWFDIVMFLGLYQGIAFPQPNNCSTIFLFARFLVCINFSELSSFSKIRTSLYICKAATVQSHSLFWQFLSTEEYQQYNQLVHLINSNKILYPEDS
jgi:hypothetical protein